MRREKGDDIWEYVRIYSNVRNSVQFKPIGNGLFEAVYFQIHPELVFFIANSDDPAPGSWRSKDVFASHPSIPDVWKYVTRIDDRITLENGEKVLPLSLKAAFAETALFVKLLWLGRTKLSSVS